MRVKGVTMNTCIEKFKQHISRVYGVPLKNQKILYDGTKNDVGNYIFYCFRNGKWCQYDLDWERSGCFNKCYILTFEEERHFLYKIPICP